MFVLTEARALAVEAVAARLAHPVPAVWAAEARLAEAAPVDVVAPGAVGAVALAFTVLAVGAGGAFLGTPEDAGRKTRLTSAARDL